MVAADEGVPREINSRAGRPQDATKDARHDLLANDLLDHG